MNRLQKKILLFCMFLASAGCANYHGMHAHSMVNPINSVHLASQSTTVIPPPHYLTNVAWWQRFHDPQLNALIRRGLADAPDIKIAAARLRATQQNILYTRAALFPSLTATAEVDVHRLGKNYIYIPPLGGHTFIPILTSLNFNYEIDWWGKNRKLLTAAIDSERMSEADMAEAKLMLATAIANTYLDLQINGVQLRTTEQIVAQQQQLFDIIQARLSRGLDSAIPLTTAQADLATDRREVAQLRQWVAIDRYQLAALVGASPEYGKQIRITALPSFNSTVPNYIPANLIARRPDITALCWQIQASIKNVQVAKTEFFPNLNLAAAAGFQSFHLSNLFTSSSIDAFVGPALSLPIFDAGLRRANLGIKYADYDLAVEQYNQTVLSAMREAAQQVATMRGVAAQKAEQTVTLNATRQNYQLSLSRYRHGLTSYLEVLQAENQWLQQNITQQQLETRYLQATVDLTKALGGGFDSLVS